MSVDELVSQVCSLSRTDQLRVIEAVRAVPLTPEEKLILKLFPPGVVAEVWFPDANGAAAEGLLKALEETRSQP